MNTVWLPDATRRPRRLAVGEFDGVHAGHREVIRGSDSVLTFEPHPRTVVAPQSAPKLLTTLEQKTDLIAALGVEELIVVPFDGARAAQTAQEFIDHELIERLGATRVSVGENFRFGNRAQGDAALLRSPGRVHDAGGGAGRDRRRDRLLDAHPRADRDRRRRRGRAAAGRAVRDARDRRPRRQARAHARLPDRQPRPGPGPRGPRPRHLRLPRGGARAWGSGRRRSRSACARRSSPAAGCSSRRSCSTSTATCTASELRLDFIERIRGEKRFDSVETLVEQMHRDVEDIRQLI